MVKVGSMHGVGANDEGNDVVKATYRCPVRAVQLQFLNC